MRILLVDLSSLFRPIWEMSGREPDPNYAANATVARVHELSSGFDHAAICCDSRKSWRKELCPTYKAQRPAQEEPLYHQLRLAKEQLAADGFPLWEAEGFEADDVIASAVGWLIEGSTKHGAMSPSAIGEVVIASSDKDMACLVADEPYPVRIKSLRSSDIMGPDGVRAKFGVRHDQMVDWLCLVGDSSDNIPGIKGIGAKTATELLNKHGSLYELYQKLGDSCTVLDLTPRLFSLLKEGVASVEMARKLITLRTDVELPFADIFKPRTPKAAPVDMTEDSMGDPVDGVIEEEPAPYVAPSEPPSAMPAANGSATNGATLAVKPAALAQVDWSKSLEPQTLSQAMNLAKAIKASHLFDSYGSAEAVLMTIMAGRSLGIDTMTALRTFHIVEGRPTMSAALMQALVLRSDSCKQFEFVERTKERATVRVWRKGWEKPQDVTYSVEDAKRAGRVKPNSNWEKDPAAMCVARCQAIGARLGWPDLLANMYDPDEVST